MAGTANVASFIASNDKTQDKAQDSKVDLKKREALQKYQRTQSERNASFIEAPATGAAQAAPKIDPKEPPPTLGQASSNATAAFSPLEGLLVEAPVAAPAPAFALPAVAGSAVQSKNVPLSPEFSAELPVMQMLGTLPNGDEHGLIAGALGKVAARVIAAQASGAIRLDLSGKKSSADGAVAPGTLSDAGTSSPTLTEAQRAAFQQAFAPISQFLGKQTAAISRGQPPPNDLGALDSKDDAAADGADPTVGDPSVELPPLPDGSDPTAVQQQVTQARQGYGTPIARIPGSLEERASNSLGVALAAQGGLPPAMDIDQLIQMVMFECENDTENELRKMSEEMQKMNEQKAAQRKLKEEYAQNHTKMEQAMRQEFGALQQSGKIANGWTFEDYANWRQVVITPPPMGKDGLQLDASGQPAMPVPTLAHPSPPDLLPPMFGKSKNPPPPVVGGGTKAGRDLTQIGDQYGLTSAQVTMLRSIFNKYILPSSAAQVGGDPEKAFTSFLKTNVGLNAAGNNIDDVVANNKAISSFLDDLKSNPTHTLALSEVSKKDLDALQATQKVIDGKRAKTPPDDTTLEVAELKKRYAELYFTDTDKAVATLLMHQCLPDSYPPETDMKGNKIWSGSDDPEPLHSRTTAFAPPTPAEIAGYKNTQDGINANLGGGQLLGFGLSVEQLTVFNQLDALAKAGQLAPAISSEADLLAALALQKDDGTDTNGVQQRNQQSLDALLAKLSTTAPAAQQEKLASLGATLKLLENAPFAAKDFGLPPGYEATCKAAWLALPESVRSSFGDDFAKFVTSDKGLNLLAGGDSVTSDNEGKVRKYFEANSSSVGGDSAVAALDALEHPIGAASTYGFSPSNQVMAYLTSLFSKLTPEQRKTFKNDVNVWLTTPAPNGVGLTKGDGKSLPDYVGNDKAVSAYATKFGGTAAADYDNAKANKFKPPQAATSPFSNDYLKFLHDKGFVGDPPPLAPPPGAATSDINPQTGDNVKAGVFAQNLPGDAQGGASLGTLADLDNLGKKADDDLQSMSEMSELKMMRLQLLMDRRSKFLETISNVLKKTSTTADNIIANLK